MLQRNTSRPLINTRAASRGGGSGSARGPWRSADTLARHIGGVYWPRRPPNVTAVGQHGHRGAHGNSSAAHATHSTARIARLARGKGDRRRLGSGTGSRRRCFLSYWRWNSGLALLRVASLAREPSTELEEVAVDKAFHCAEEETPRRTWRRRSLRHFRCAVAPQP